MKSILILVSARNESFFGKEVEAIEETWAKTIIEGNYDNIEYFSYTAMTEEQRENTTHTKLGVIDTNCNSVFVPTEDDMMHTYEKFHSTLKTLAYKIKKYDYVLLTTTNVYVNVPLLNEFVQNLDDSDRNIYCGRIISGKYTSAPYSYCLYGSMNSLLLKVSEYIPSMLDETLCNRAFLKDKTPSDEYWTKYRHSVDETVVGLMVNSELLRDGLDHMKYYRDWNMRHLYDIDPSDYNKELTMMLGDENADKEIQNFYDVYDRIGDSYDSEKLNAYLNENSPRITQILDESADVLEITIYTYEDYVKWLDENGIDIKNIDKPQTDKPSCECGNVWRKINNRFWWLDDSRCHTFISYYNLPQWLFDYNCCNLETCCCNRGFVKCGGGPVYWTDMPCQGQGDCTINDLPIDSSGAIGVASTIKKVGDIVDAIETLEGKQDDTEKLLDDVKDAVEKVQDIGDIIENFEKRTVWISI